MSKLKRTSWVWLDFPAEANQRGELWCLLCNTLIGTRQNDGVWPNSPTLMAMNHFDTERHREQWELYRLE